eukprot:9948775-Alexandrium_andersonii.AAC.1
MSGNCLEALRRRVVSFHRRPNAPRKAPEQLGRGVRPGQGLPGTSARAAQERPQRDPEDWNV